MAIKILEKKIIPWKTSKEEWQNEGSCMLDLSCNLEVWPCSTEEDGTEGWIFCKLVKEAD